MPKGSKSGGGQGLPDRAAEEQATTRGERGFERASRADILYVHCLRFLSGLFYTVLWEMMTDHPPPLGGPGSDTGARRVPGGPETFLSILARFLFYNTFMVTSTPLRLSLTLYAESLTLSPPNPPNPPVVTLTVPKDAAPYSVPPVYQKSLWLLTDSSRTRFVIYAITLHRKR
jgi:hypothetical protein